MADADPIALDAPLPEQGLALVGFKLFLCAVDPAAAQPQRGRGQHQIAHDKAAVLHGIFGTGIGQHYQNGRSAVHRVGVLAHDSGVHAGELGAGGSVLHHHDLCALAAHGAGSVGAGFQHGIQLFVGDLLRLIGTAAAAAFNGFQGFVGHSKSLPKSMCLYCITRQAGV